MKVIFSPQCLEYHFPGHPEQPKRVKLIYQQLKAVSEFEFVTPEKATDEDLRLVHSQRLIDSVKSNTFSNVDTPNIDNIYDYALLSVSAAIKAAEICQTEKYSFALTRPPGHHAGKDFLEGFCYFNNLAVAVMKLIQQGKKVAILDIDVHHGNGTQDIFLGKNKVVFCSLHQIPLYPGTGWQSQANCYNFPLSPGTDINIFKTHLLRALKTIKQFKPDILGVSLGLDTYKHDSLAQINLEVEDYQVIGKLISQLNIKTFMVLEGGYSQAIGKCAKEYLGNFVV